MTLDLLPHTKPLSGFLGPGGVLERVRIDKHVARSIYGVRLTRVIEELSQEWPRLAGAVLEVTASGSLKPPAYAVSRISTFRTVSGHLAVSKHALRSDLSDVELLGLSVVNRSVGSTFEEVLVHEWGHLLMKVDLSRRYLHDFEQGVEDFVRFLERESGVPRDDAAAALSGMAYVDSHELVAEAFVAARAGSGDPFPATVMEAFQNMWTPPPSYLPGWAI
jgi:hypothetical protein